MTKGQEISALIRIDAINGIEYNEELYAKEIDKAIESQLKESEENAELLDESHQLKFTKENVIEAISYSLIRDAKAGNGPLYSSSQYFEMWMIKNNLKN